MLVSECSKIGLKIKTTKNELMKLRALDPPSDSIGDSNLKKVDNFVFLRSCTIKNGEIRTQVNIQIGKASSTFNYSKNV